MRTFNFHQLSMKRKSKQMIFLNLQKLISMNKRINKVNKLLLINKRMKQMIILISISMKLVIKVIKNQLQSVHSVAAQQKNKVKQTIKKVTTPRSQQKSNSNRKKAMNLLHHHSILGQKKVMRRSFLKRAGKHL